MPMHPRGPGPTYVGERRIPIGFVSTLVDDRRPQEVKTPGSQGADKLNLVTPINGLSPKLLPAHHSVDPKAEAWVVQRLAAKLQDGPSQAPTPLGADVC